MWQPNKRYSSREQILIKRNLLFAALAVSLTGCSKYYYNPNQQVLPQHIRKIAVRPFVNHTKEVHIEDKLTMAVHSVFNRDGRYQIVDEDQAEGVVVGEITRYMLMPLAHDMNGVTSQYKLWILIDVSFYDKSRAQTLWKEKHLEGMLTYPSASSGQPGGMMEVEAQEKIWDKLAQDIATRTFEGFGTVTGVSEKAVPKSSPVSNPLPEAPTPSK